MGIEPHIIWPIPASAYKNLHDEHIYVLSPEGKNCLYTEVKTAQYHIFFTKAFIAGLIFLPPCVDIYRKGFLSMKFYFFINFLKTHTVININK